MQEERRQGLWGQVCRPRFKPDLPLNSRESSATDFTTLCLSVPIYEMGVQQYVPPVAIWDKSEAKHVKLPARCLSHMPSTRAYAHSIPARWVSPDVSSGHGTEILMLRRSTVLHPGFTSLRYRFLEPTAEILLQWPVGAGWRLPPGDGRVCWGLSSAHHAEISHKPAFSLPPGTVLVFQL